MYSFRHNVRYTGNGQGHCEIVLRDDVFMLYNRYTSIYLTDLNMFTLKHNSL